jgi:hypothetical protein
MEKKKENDMHIFCFWTGDNPLTPNRLQCLDQLRRDSGVEVILVTKANLAQYILKDHPLHPVYPFLSETHRADYLRTYFMHFHGGGYSDIKYTTGSWVSAFELLENSPDKWINGYQAEHRGVIAYLPHGDYWQELIGNAAYICKPQTPLTTEWYDGMMAFLEEKSEDIFLHPATNPRDCKEESDYPIEWNEMLGRIFHRVSLPYRDRILQTVPISIFYSYL